MKMGRQLLIRCNVADISLAQAIAKVEDLLNVKCAPSETFFGTSHLFSCMGLDGALYLSPVGSSKGDRRLEGFDFVIDLGLYAIPVGKTYEDIDILHCIALFVAGIIARHLRWTAIVCTDDNHVIETLSPPVENN